MSAQDLTPLRALRSSVSTGVFFIAIGMIMLAVVLWRHWAEGRDNVAARIATHDFEDRLPAPLRNFRETTKRYRMSLSAWLRMQSLVAVLAIVAGIIIVLRSA
jgi:hypothetical protein